MNILIADDNNKLREMIKEILAEYLDTVHSIIECKDGAEAITQYEKHHPDWVLMDIEMGIMDGIAASKKIIQKYPQAKIMIVTQYNDAAYREAAKKMGVIAYVLKEDLVDIPVLLKSILTH